MCVSWLELLVDFLVFFDFVYFLCFGGFEDLIISTRSKLSFNFRYTFASDSRMVDILSHIIFINIPDFELNCARFKRRFQQRKLHSLANFVHIIPKVKRNLPQELFFFSFAVAFRSCAKDFVLENLFVSLAIFGYVEFRIIKIATF